MPRKSSNKIVFKITVPNWEAQHPERKKSNKKTLIPNNFCTNGLHCELPPTYRWLYLAILLQCSEECQATIKLSESAVKAIVKSSTSAVKAILTLESFQLVTSEILNLPLYYTSKAPNLNANKSNSFINAEVCQTHAVACEGKPSKKTKTRAVAREGKPSRDELHQKFSDGWRDKAVFGGSSTRACRRADSGIFPNGRSLVQRKGPRLDYVCL
jgi:hypothetical protein